jgi:hypothetical protein
MCNRIVLPVAIAISALALSGSAFAGEKCYTLHRGAGANVADAYIAGHEPAASHGERDYLLVGFEAASLLRFDLSSVPSTARVTSAFLRLHDQSGSTPAGLVAHRVTAPWTEDDATWLTCGGAFEQAAEAVHEGDVEGAVSFEVTDLVQMWIDGAVPNDGMLIAPAGPARTKLASSENKDVDRRPRLEVCFAVPPDPPDETSASEGGLDVGDELLVLGLDG